MVSIRLEICAAGDPIKLRQRSRAVYPAEDERCRKFNYQESIIPRIFLPARCRGVKAVSLFKVKKVKRNRGHESSVEVTAIRETTSNVLHPLSILQHHPTAIFSRIRSRGKRIKEERFYYFTILLLLGSFGEGGNGGERLDQ